MGVEDNSRDAWRARCNQLWNPSSEDLGGHEAVIQDRKLEWTLDKYVMRRSFLELAFMGYLSGRKKA